MKEISANLQRDVKDLLEESANIVIGFFKNGVCTARGVTARWRDFTHDISGAVVTLFKSSKEDILPDLSVEQEPLVTVIESGDIELPIGTKMTLSEAERKIADLSDSKWDSDEPARPVKVAIDYMMDGQIDRYCLPLNIGAGEGSMLEQMEHYVETCLKYPSVTTAPFYEAPDDLAKLLHEQFGPQLQTGLEQLAGGVINLFQQHYTITRLEQQFETQAMAIPEKEQEKFLQHAKAAITDLRKAANTSKTIAPAQERTAPVSPTPARSGDRPRRSGKGKLHQIKKEQSQVQPCAKSRPAPER